MCQDFPEASGAGCPPRRFPPETIRLSANPLKTVKEHLIT